VSEVIKHLADYDRAERYEAVVVSSERITPEGSGEEVRELVLDVARPEFSFRIGQSIGVVVPGGAEFGKRQHFRLYSVSDLPEQAGAGRPRIKIAVRRCSYIDAYSGEEFPGIASNYLCDLAPGDTILMNGPFGIVFEVPAEPDANLILIGSGTGIAYMNDQKNDFAQYYDEETFQAFKALSARPGWSDAIAWDAALQEHGEELWAMLSDAKTYVYVAGLEKMIDELDAVFATLAGSPEKWSRRKAELMAGKRWVQLVY
jgi:ferredoxin--NADP+ reductase